MLGSVRQAISPDLGLDLGTANSVIYERGAGVLISEPTVIAYDAAGSIIAFGNAAKEMEGRAPGRVTVVRPLRRGTISDFRAAHAIVGTLVDRALAARPRIAPRLVASIPGCATDIECKAVEQAVRAAGARYTTYVPQAVAAAVGAGLDITRPEAQMIVDIGGGTTEIAILAMTGVIRLCSVTIGGDFFDTAIQARLARDRFHIGALTAESLKIELGYAGRPRGRSPLLVRGIDLARGGPSEREVDEVLVGDAMSDGVTRIVRAVRSVLEIAPPDVAADLMDFGITITGGGALIPGLAGEMAAQTNLPTTAAPDPLTCVARGAGEILGSAPLLEQLRPHADRITRWYQSLRTGMRESYSP